MTRAPLDRVVGIGLVICALSILLPLTNIVPGIGVAIIAIGLIERDGLTVLGGLAVGLGWVVLLAVGGVAALTGLAQLVTG